MRGERSTPEGQVADAVRGNWVDRLAPRFARPYLRLSRADRPIGVWLLLLPCWWGLGLAALEDGLTRWEDLWIAGGCAAGAWLMRGAGCTWNDIVDRDFDARVARTRSRPIPSGQVSPARAAAWMVAQALLALGILLGFHPAAILLGALSLVPVAVYPFAKRFTWWPQAFLGIAFNWGALLAYAAHAGSLGVPAIAAYAGGIAWTLFYDTIYAHQDAEDDALVGIKSSARLLGARTPAWLGAFAAATVALLAISILATGAFDRPAALAAALAGPLAMGLHLAWQVRRFDAGDSDGLLRLFRSNRDAGLVLAICLAAALALS